MNFLKEESTPDKVRFDTNITKSVAHLLGLGHHHTVKDLLLIMSTKPMTINAICLPLEACFVPYSICFGQEVKLGREILFHPVELYSLPSHFIVSSIEHGGTRTFFYMVDQYFGNDSLEPFECIFMAPLALFTLWRYPQRGSQT